MIVHFSEYKSRYFYQFHSLLDLFYRFLLYLEKSASYGSAAAHTSAACSTAALCSSICPRSILSSFKCSSYSNLRFPETCRKYHKPEELLGLELLLNGPLSSLDIQDFFMGPDGANPIWDWG